MKILVTGACGFIGSHTLDRLIAVGDEVVGIDNLSTGSRKNVEHLIGHPRLELIVGDASDFDFMWGIIEDGGFDAVIHLAAKTCVPESFKQAFTYFSQNTEAAHNVAEIAFQNRVKNFVFASSASVYGPLEGRCSEANTMPNPQSPYAATKLAAEALIAGAASRIDGTRWYALRYFNVYGPRQNAGSHYSGVITKFNQAIQAGKPIKVFGDGKATRDFVHVEDVAKMNMLAARQELSLRAPSGAYNVCTSVGTSINGLIDTLGKIYEVEPDVKYRPSREGDLRHSRGSVSKSYTTFGFLPRKPVNGLTQTYKKV